MSFFGKLTTRERYGFRLALRLAKTYATKEAVSLSDISEKEEISTKYLEQLIVPFKKAKWVKSLRGREGGYLMIKDPKNLSLRDVMALLNDDLIIVQCLNPKSKHCNHRNNCLARPAWEKIQKALDEALYSIKIGELIKPKKT